MKKFVTNALGALSAVAMTAPGFAHHSTAMYDTHKTLKLTGTIEFAVCRFEWCL